MPSAVTLIRSTSLSDVAEYAYVVSTRVLVATSRRADLGAAGQVVREAFGDHDVPSTLLGGDRARVRGPAGRDRGGRRRP